MNETARRLSLSEVSELMGVRVVEPLPDEAYCSEVCEDLLLSGEHWVAMTLERLKWLGERSVTRGWRRNLLFGDPRVDLRA